jgi:hypothetical protein
MNRQEAVFRVLEDFCPVPDRTFQDIRIRQDPDPDHQKSVKFCTLGPWIFFCGFATVGMAQYYYDYYKNLIFMRKLQ